jgi:hypothetical protein
MSTKGNDIDYLVTWSGDGATSQDKTLGYTPRSIVVIGLSPTATGIQLSKVAAMGTDLALELPAGTVVSALEIIAGGFRVSGNANQAGWTYHAVCLA